MNKGTHLITSSVSSFLNFILYQPFITLFKNTMALCILRSSDFSFLIGTAYKKAYCSNPFYTSNLIIHFLALDCTNKLTFKRTYNCTKFKYNISQINTFLSLILCWHRQNFSYDIKYFYRKPEIMIQPELNETKIETIHVYIDKNNGTYYIL